MIEMAERKEICENCKFWDSRVCRKYAPRPGLRGVIWVETSSADWCGEFEVKPGLNKAGTWGER